MATWVLLGSKLNGDYLNNKDSDAPCLIFDTVDSIEFDWPLEVTAYPVESGTYISDHLQERNEQYTLTGVVTNTPIISYGANQIGYSTLGSGTKIKNTRTKTAVTLLKSIKSSREPLTFVSEFEVLEDVVIKQVSFTQDPQHSDVLIFRISLEKIRFASAQTTTINVSTSNTTATNTTSSNTAGGSDTKTQKTGSYVSDVESSRASELTVGEEGE